MSSRISVQTIGGIPLNFPKKTVILEQIKKNIESQSDFLHVVSINPENIITAQKDKTFKEIILSAQIRIPDGFGIVIASQICGIPPPERIAGADLLVELMEWAGKSRLRVLLIGGEGNLAKNIADCYKNKYSEADFAGTMGIFDIRHPKNDENKHIFSIVTAMRPHLVFVAFGSPWQEKWIWSNRTMFSGATCMGVGGGFDFLGGRIKRAPKIIRQVGIEWLWRLVLQPWRMKRQMQLFSFIKLVSIERFFR